MHLGCGARYAEIDRNLRRDFGEISSRISQDAMEGRTDQETLYGNVEALLRTLSEVCNLS